MYRCLLFIFILFLALLAGCNPAGLITSSVTPESSPSPVTSLPAQVSFPSALPAETPVTAPTLVFTATPSPTVTLPLSTLEADTPVSPKPLPPLDAFRKGIWFNDWGFAFDRPRPPLYGELYNPSQADPSLKYLATTGANWISLIVTLYQEKLSSTSITANQYRTASDDSIRHVVDLAHSLGIRVALAPGIFLSDDPNQNWTQIGTLFDTETQWQQWFASYQENIIHYASFAQEAGVDCFYIGSELPGTTHREDDWRRIIAAVRERFKGSVSYDSVYWGVPVAEFERIPWWDSLDYIATDFWHPLTHKTNPTLAELKQGWLDSGWINALEAVSKKFNKPTILSEIGYNNFDGVNTDPAGIRIKGASPDLQEQAACYQAALEVLLDRPWLKGIFWWQWDAISIQWPTDPHGKPAEEVLRKYYSSR
jgi:hypothetical protein